MRNDFPEEGIGDLLETLDRAGDIPIMALDDTGKVVLFNSACEMILDLDSEEVVGRRIDELLAEKEGVEITDSFPDSGSSPKYVRDWFQAKHGESKKLDLNVLSADKGKDGADLTILICNAKAGPEPEEQRDPEGEEVKETAEKYKTLFQYAYDAILLSRFETGRIFEANPEAENLLGYRTEELLQKRLPELFTPDDFSRLKEQLAEGRFSYRADQPVQKKDGSRLVASMSSSLIELHGKKTILSLLQDMTKRIELEEELRSRADSLKKSNEKLEEIIHIISHDLKEPLRSIGTYSDMIFNKYREELADSSFRRLENLKDDATRLKNMLDEVSNLAQVTTDVSPERVDVPELVEEVKGELGMDLDDAEITVDSDFPEVKFDKFQLKVLLKNLIANGLKYNQEPKRVEVGYNLEPGSSKLAVLVRDDGKGIAQEHHDRVFRMFEQLEPEEAPTGTGAGLALCKRIVEGNNEKIWLDSDPGVGTAVGFTVPLFEREE